MGTLLACNQPNGGARPHRRDDVETRKLKSMCGGNSDSFCHSVSALCLFQSYLLLSVLYIITMAKRDTKSGD